MGKILIVEDDESLRHVQTQLIERMGLEVVAVADPLTALDQFTADPDSIDLVLSDMTMPKMTGREMGEKMIDLKPGLPFILCSGYSDVISRADIESSGFFAFLQKPISIKVLRENIRQALEKA